jgi:hypothetical protein
MDGRALATALAFVASLIAGAALGWLQGSGSPGGSALAAATVGARPTAIEPAAGGSAIASVETSREEPADAEPTYAVYDGDVFAIGDSVLAGAAVCLAARGVKVNAEQSRQVSAAIDILERRSTALPPRIIVHLGTNGGATQAQLDAVMAVLGPDRLVLWSTIQLPDDPARYTYERSTNDAIAALAERYPNVRVFDWESISRQQPEWLYVEGIHMTPEGCEGYAGLVEPQVRAPSPFGNRVRE